jgi:hypothetical protein
MKRAWVYIQSIFRLEMKKMQWGAQLGGGGGGGGGERVGGLETG